MIMTSLGNPDLDALLARLHGSSAAQDPDLMTYFTARAKAGDLSWKHLDGDADRFLADKLVALEQDKALFCHRLCLGLRARRAVEAGTSHGVSTIYLAEAVRQVAAADGGTGVVIGTEYEPMKAEAARRNWSEASLTEFIDLREGDLRETLSTIEGPVDFALIDIWTELARPALERIAPHLRPGAIVVADNTAQFRDSYADYFDFIADPANRLVTQTLPFEGGLELTVKV
jgi:predicted O-methyltransferase YrrM